MIQGDGISYESLGKILQAMDEKGFAADNLAFGSGGGLLQKLNRDTQKCAFKCSAVVVGGEPRHVFKDPVTDSGKKSKKGRLKLVKDAKSGAISTLTEVGPDDATPDLLVEVFRDGRLLVDQTFAEVRARARVS